MKELKGPAQALAMLSLLALSACSLYSKSFDGAPPATPPGSYEIIQNVTVSKTGFRFFYIPLTVPSVTDIVAEQVALAGGDAAINVETTFSEALPFLILSFPSVQVRCDIIRYTDGTAPVTTTPPAPAEEKKRRGLLEGKKP